MYPSTDVVMDAMTLLMVSPSSSVARTDPAGAPNSSHPPMNVRTRCPRRSLSGAGPQPAVRDASRDPSWGRSQQVEQLQRDRLQAKSQVEGRVALVDHPSEL